MKTKHKQKTWFIKVRGSYLPNSWQGWLLYLPYLAYLLSVLTWVMVNNYGLWQAILTLVPNWVASLAVMTWIAKAKS